jgi:hypothetical protein
MGGCHGSGLSNSKCGLEPSGIRVPSSILSCTMRVRLKRFQMIYGVI